MQIQYKDIEEGDYVLSENPDTGEQEYKKVLQTFVNEKRTLVHVYIEDEEIITTDGHPFYVEGVGFVPAQNLQSGDIVRLSDGRKVPVISIEIEYLDEPVYVYNFEVEDSHTYYVSEIGVLVHNTGCGGASSAEVETMAMSSKAGKGGSKSVHGNSKTSTKPQHGYEIYNKKTGDVVKTGISRQTLNKNGTSPRANTQVNKLNKLAGEDIYYARIVIEDMPDRVSALEWEKENALKLWEERNSMEIHKRPRPWEN